MSAVGDEVEEGRACRGASSWRWRRQLHWGTHVINLRGDLPDRVERRYRIRRTRRHTRVWARRRLARGHTRFV